MIETSDRLSLVMSEIMTPEKVNFSGKVHGGHILSLLDRVAYATAARYAGKYVVTLSVDQVLFKNPVYVGELLTCYAQVNYVGHSSMEIGIRVESENLLTREVRHTNTCYFSMVAIDEHGKPSPVAPLIPSTPEEKRRYEEGKWRKNMRIKLQEEHKKHKEIVKNSIG